MQVIDASRCASRDLEITFKTIPTRVSGRSIGDGLGIDGGVTREVDLGRVKLSRGVPITTLGRPGYGARSLDQGKIY